MAGKEASQLHPACDPMQVDEKTKTVCKPAGYAEALTADEAEVSAIRQEHMHTRRLPSEDSHCSACPGSCCQLQDVKSKIETRYRVRLILDNLPITTYDLERGPESVRPGVWVQSALS
jgi:hypothetical protein